MQDCVPVRSGARIANWVDRRRPARRTSGNTLMVVIDDDDDDDDGDDDDDVCANLRQSVTELPGCSVGGTRARWPGQLDSIKLCSSPRSSRAGVRSRAVACYIEYHYLFVAIRQNRVAGRETG